MFQAAVVPIADTHVVGDAVAAIGHREIKAGVFADGDLIGTSRTQGNFELGFTSRRGSRRPVRIGRRYGRSRRRRRC